MLSVFVTYSNGQKTIRERDCNVVSKEGAIQIAKEIYSKYRASWEVDELTVSFRVGVCTLYVIKLSEAAGLECEEYPIFQIKAPNDLGGNSPIMVGDTQVAYLSLLELSDEELKEMLMETVHDAIKRMRGDNNGI